nr:MAG TPA: hypothetical protein [Bacteriophage sp.]DAS65861.1 MAG TPA: hypothetical protein [Caudoviricetes sp.]
MNPDYGINQDKNPVSTHRQCYQMFHTSSTVLPNTLLLFNHLP